MDVLLEVPLQSLEEIVLLVIKMSLSPNGSISTPSPTSQLCSVHSDLLRIKVDMVGLSLVLTRLIFFA